MRDNEIKLNGTYRMKPQVFHNTLQANGEPHKSASVTVMRIKSTDGRARRWFFDAAGNAYRASDFVCVEYAIPVEL